MKKLFAIRLSIITGRGLLAVLLPARLHLILMLAGGFFNAQMFAQPNQASPWLRTGNVSNAQSPNTDFIGFSSTVFPSPLIFKTMGVERARITEEGKSNFLNNVNVTGTLNIGPITGGPGEGGPPFDLNVFGNANILGKMAITGDIITSGDITANCVKASCLNVTDKISTTRITSLPGDSLIHFGDSSIVINGNQNSINALVGAAEIFPPLARNMYIQNQPLIYPGSNNTILNRYKGKVGIGINNPQAKLEVQGSISIYDGDGNTSLFFGRESVSNQTFGKWGIQYVQPGALDPQATGGLNFWIPSAPGNNFGNNYLFLADDGKVGIGTSYIPLGYKLAVNGKIIAEEVRVLLRGQWPDYIFKQKLMPWEKFMEEIDSLGHLPGMPSENTVTNKGGFSLGEIQVSHLALTEKLFLYLGETKKELKSVKDENEKLKKQNQEFEERIGKLEKIMDK